MFGILNKAADCGGSVYLRGSMPPRLAELRQLERAGATVKPRADDARLHWSADLRHPTWGRAAVACVRGAPRAPDVLIDIDIGLTPAEKAEAREGGSSLLVRVAGERANVLRDRKRLLYFLRLLMGDDGLVGFDHTAGRFWSRGALDDELRHDADLDVESLMALHAVRSDDGSSTRWLHSHGLAELGRVDFDILNPSKALGGQWFDMLRAFAYAIVEGTLTLGEKRWAVTSREFVSFIDVAEFNRSAAATAVALRDAADPEHNRDRGVFCEPRGGGLSAWLKRGAAPSQFLSSLTDFNGVIHLSGAATQLMAERAQATVSVLGELMSELAEFGFPVLAKIGRRTDSDPAQREHLWFTVHGVEGDTLDVTCESEPIDIRGLRRGERGRHGVEDLTDWAIMTPAGMITPRSMRPARAIRENREMVMAAMRRHAKGA